MLCGDTKLIGRLGLFKISGQGYAVPLNRLLRVIEGGCAGVLPLIPDGMAGMLVVDKEVIPLLDSNWLPGVSSGRGLSAEFKVLVATEYGSVALPADATVGIVAESRGKLDELEQNIVEYVSQSFNYRENSYQILNVDAFIMSLIRS